MNSSELIGFAAGTFVAVSLIPQAIKSWKSKSTSDISLLWGGINLIGQLLWLLYGVFIDSASLIVMSSITLIMAISILSLKIRYG